MGYNESSAKRKTHSSECHQKETGESSLTVHLKDLEPKEANIPKRSRWQEIIKLGAEINQPTKQNKQKTIQ
jgi:hypothetical protein